MRFIIPTVPEQCGLLHVSNSRFLWAFVQCVLEDSPMHCLSSSKQDAFLFLSTFGIETSWKHTKIDSSYHQEHFKWFWFQCKLRNSQLRNETTYWSFPQTPSPQRSIEQFFSLTYLPLLFQNLRRKSTTLLGLIKSIPPPPRPTQF